MNGAARGAPRRGAVVAVATAFALVLSACAPAPQTPPPAPAAAPAPRPEPAAPSQADLRKARAERNRAANAAATLASAGAGSASQARRALYADYQRARIARGLLRRDRVPQDAPIDADRLVRDFAAIALRDEYAADGSRVPGGRPAPLRRWQGPVLLQPEFGASTDTGTARILRAEIADIATRLSQASGHPIRVVDQGGNFPVMVLTEDERRSVGPRLAQLVPGIPPADIAALTDLAPGNLCTVFAYSHNAEQRYARAIALIRAELPPLLRRSCLHEELAQGMGLANDSPAARPSIFNDDEEFAELTRHDELLLQILYDPRLAPGMTEAEALPIVRVIAAELLATGL